MYIILFCMQFIFKFIKLNYVLLPVVQISLNMNVVLLFNNTRLGLRLQKLHEISLLRVIYKAIICDH